jgi:hypothetical protein
LAGHYVAMGNKEKIKLLLHYRRSNINKLQ